MENLNEAYIPTDGEYDGSLQNFSSKTNIPFNEVEVVFRDIEQKLIEFILSNKHNVIVGCVAWLTSTPILKALAQVDNVQFLVQKEDFLRPDINSIFDWKNALRNLYDKLKCSLCRYDFCEEIARLSVCGDIGVHPIRVVGNHNADKKPAFPRSHNKFLVVLEPRKKNPININQPNDLKPIAAWTGSFNFTKNATFSFENAVILKEKSGDHPILNAFMREHGQIYGLSEPLNWERDWIEPEYRIGT